MPFFTQVPCAWAVASTCHSSCPGKLRTRTICCAKARFGSIITQPSGRSAVARAPAAAIAARMRFALSSGRYCHTTECVSTRVTPACCGSASRASSQSAASARARSTPHARCIAIARVSRSARAGVSGQT